MQEGGSPVDVKDEVGINPPSDEIVTTPPPPASPITTDAELKTVVGDIAAGNQGVIPKVEAVLPTVNTNELLDKKDMALGEDDRTITAADKVKTVDVDKPTRPVDEDYGQVGAIERTKAALDLMGEPDLAEISDEERKELLIADEDVVQGSVSTDSVAEAQTLELDKFDERATVKFQLGELFSSIEEGGPPPAWASPAVRKVSAIMAQRGLGSSSMAASAITQAVYEAGIPIAAQDANKYAAIQLQN